MVIGASHPRSSTHRIRRPHLHRPGATTASGRPRAGTVGAPPRQPRSSPAADAVEIAQPLEPLFVAPPVTAPADGEGVGHEPSRTTFTRRHRRGLTVIAAVVVALGAAVGAFAYEWAHTGPRPLSMSTAYQRFRSGGSDKNVDPGSLRPEQGVYAYRGSGYEHISLPPRSQVEGRSIPGTVSYLSDGCWTWRLDYSDSHWQSATLCDHQGNLVQVGRAGWYRWNFVALSISDTATFRCTPEIEIPSVLAPGQRFPFTCTGSNNPIHTAPVTMRGTNGYVGAQTLRIAGREVPTLHFHEVATFSGGQQGTNVADMWFSTVNGLPVKGSWSTRVSSPTFLGTSTLTGHASFVLASFTAHT